jgi:putative ATP-binding cassette transporter
MLSRPLIPSFIEPLCRLQLPQWVLIDQALDALEEDARRQILTMLENGLPNSTIIHIGRTEGGSHFFTRVLHLVKDPRGRTLSDTGLIRQA